MRARGLAPAALGATAVLLINKGLGMSKYEMIFNSESYVLKQIFQMNFPTDLQ